LVVELYIPPGKTCMILSGVVHFAPVLAGLKKGRLTAYGSSINGDGVHSIALGATTTQGGVCQVGITFAGGCSARTASVTAGASSVTLDATASGVSLATLCARFHNNGYVAVAGFDLQGAFSSAYGFPPNPQWSEWIKIAPTGVNSCSGSGVITFATTLQNSYLSTWPLYSSGAATEADQGGPATIYSVGSGIAAPISVDSWDGEAEVYGLTTDINLYVMGRSFYGKDITMNGTGCIWPSQNGSATFVNTSGLNCIIEVDKMIGTLTYDNSPIKRIFFQSSSTADLIVRNTVFPNNSPTANIDGTPRRAAISNSTIPFLKLGPQAYGEADSFSCTNCVIGNVLTGPSVIFKGGTGDPGANVFFASPNIASGVFSIPDSMAVTGFANNGSGFVRLTVASTTGWATGLRPGHQGLFGSCPGTCAASFILTVVDATHFDTNLAFASYTWSGGGSMTLGAQQWNVPGHYFSFSSSTGPATQFYQITGVTQDATGTHVATTFPGSAIPTIPLSGPATVFLPPSIANFTCTNCTGTAQAVDMSTWPANKPIFQYSNRSYSNLTAMETGTLLGAVTSITITVSDAYTGATNPMRFQLFGNTVNAAGTLQNYAGIINLRQAGIRVITPAGVTCDTGGGPVGGACSGDSSLTLPASTSRFANTLTPSKLDGSPVDDTWAMNYSFVLDQGVVWP
jgi:hypothetical protein